TPAALYQQQDIQAATTNLDYFESFFEYLRELDLKVLRCIMQAWSQERDLSEGGQAPVVHYDPAAVRQIDADVSIGDVADTATYRQLWESDLQQFLSAGFIDFFTYLEFSSHPKAEQLLKHMQQMPLLQQLGGMGALELGAALQASGGNPMLPAPGRGPIAPTARPQADSPNPVRG